MKNVYASAQQNVNQRSQNAANREAIGNAVEGINSAVDLTRRGDKLSRITALLGNQYDAYNSGGADRTLPPEAQLASVQKAQELQLLGENLDVTNIDKFADLYGNFTKNTPDITKLISSSRIAQIRANALSEIARTRETNKLRLQREKLIYGDGDSSGLGSLEGESDDAGFGMLMDMSLWGD